MIPQTTLINDWSAGEISPKMYGRHGFDIHDRGAQLLDNFEVTNQAILTKRPGTEELAAAYAAGVRLIPYEYSDTEAYLIEMSNLYIRVWRNDAVVAATSTNIPWTTAQLFDVQFCQSDMGVFFTHASWQPVALVRTAADTFAAGVIVFVYNTGGYYTSHNTSNVSGDNEFDVTASIAAGTPQQATFVVEHASGQYDSYYYTSWSGTKFSGVSPTLKRTYDNTDKMTIAHRYHSKVATDPTIPFGAAGNYPSTVAIVNGKLCFGGGTNDPQRVWESVPWGYEIDTSNNFVVQMIMHEDVVITADVLTDASTWSTPSVAETETQTSVRRIQSAGHAIDLVVGSDRSDQILTMASAKHLFVGTTASEWVIPASITALNPYVEKPVTRYGCSRVQPTMLGKAIIVATRDKKQIFEYKIDEMIQGVEPIDLTTFADHITGTTGIVQVDVAKIPYKQIWCVRADGTIALCTYERGAGVLAWQTVSPPSGWTFKSVAVLNVSGTDVVYAAMNDGATSYVVKFKDLFPATQAACVFMDLAYDVTADGQSLVAGSTLTAAWLAGATVTVMVDGVDDGDEVADGSGNIDLTGHSGSQVWVGIPYTAKYRSVQAKAQISSGAADNTFKRVFGLFIRVYRTLDLEAGYNTYDVTTTEEYSFGATWVDDIIELPFNGSYDREACINIVSAEPYPCTITSITPKLVGPGR